jgi:hypothetical protein
VTGVRAAALLLALLAAVVAGGCGASERDPERSQAYASQVSDISTRTNAQLTKLADRSDYRKADAAAASTRAYAVAIREAAGALRRATPPDSVAAQHASLVTLYDRTARALDGLVVRFAAAQDPPELATLAQELSSDVQQYASQEQQLRAAIERSLGASTTPPATER